MRLSLALGVPLSLLDDVVNELDFQTYAAYFAHETDVGQRVDEWGAGILAATINQWRRSSPVRPESLDPDRWGDVARDREKSLASRLKSWAIAASCR